MPRSRAFVETRFISSKSKVAWCSRRTGDSTEMAPTASATRPEAVRSRRRSTSSQRKVASPGARGTRLSCESCWAQSPESL
jgi:hypothetical protein